ncbi:MAG: hypothetical protein BWZ09_02518 [Alphaproteobacteria bacterium ADurb.BinA305]|nr:MAG: hypothetical protein BWZ09_02518 [Alphaproteobacteria bacterium ADurb.BinA305]
MSTNRCVVILDEYGDRHAEKLDDPEALADEAWDLAAGLGLDDGEEIQYGTADVADPGEARLGHVDVVWVGSFVLGEDAGMSDAECRAWERRQMGY